MELLNFDYLSHLINKFILTLNPLIRLVVKQFMPFKKKKDYNKYMREYMPRYRQTEREIIREFKRIQGIPDKRRRKQK